MTVTPGSTLTIKVGAGGGAAVAANVNSELTSATAGGSGYVMVAWSTDKGQRHSRSMDLVFNRSQAKRIANEISEASQRTKYGGRLDRTMMGLEPGDVIKIDSQSLNLNRKARVLDVGIRLSDLTVSVYLEDRGAA